MSLAQDADHMKKSIEKNCPCENGFGSSCSSLFDGIEQTAGSDNFIIMAFWIPIATMINHRKVSDSLDPVSKGKTLKWKRGRAVAKQKSGRRG